MAKRTPHMLAARLASGTPVTFAQLQAALGNASRATTFRYLKQVRHLRSYNHNGRYYTHRDPLRFDRYGLLSLGGVHFSRDGTLAATVRRLVGESAAGCTHKELQTRLHVRVQAFLLAAVRQRALRWQRMAGVWVYLSGDPAVGDAQRRARQARPAHARQRRYELLRAFFLEGRSASEVRHKGQGNILLLQQRDQKHRSGHGFHCVRVPDPPGQECSYVLHHDDPRREGDRDLGDQDDQQVSHILRAGVRVLPHPSPRVGGRKTLAGRARRQEGGGLLILPIAVGRNDIRSSTSQIARNDESTRQVQSGNRKPMSVDVGQDLEPEAGLGELNIARSAVREATYGAQRHQDASRAGEAPAGSGGL